MPPRGDRGEPAVHGLFDDLLFRPVLSPHRDGSVLPQADEVIHAAVDGDELARGDLAGAAVGEPPRGDGPVAPQPGGGARRRCQGSETGVPGKIELAVAVAAPPQHGAVPAGGEAELLVRGDRGEAVPFGSLALAEPVPAPGRQGSVPSQPHAVEVPRRCGGELAAGWTRLAVVVPAPARHRPVGAQGEAVVAAGGDQFEIASPGGCGCVRHPALSSVEEPARRTPAEAARRVGKRPLSDSRRVTAAGTSRIPCRAGRDRSGPWHPAPGRWCCCSC